MKLVVSGCPRNCAEFYVKDVGIVAVKGARSYDFVPRIGLAELQMIVVDDRDGVASRLDEAMQRSVDAYCDPWQELRQPVTEGQLRDALPLVELPEVPVR